MLHFVFLSLLTSTVLGQLCESRLKTHRGTLKLTSDFCPIKDDASTGLPQHHRTPFAVSPNGQSAYLAYLDASGKGVHVQAVNPITFTPIGKPVTMAEGMEAGGLYAHDDGFALLTNEPMPSGTANAPSKNEPVAVLYRYTLGKQSFKTYLGGPSGDAAGASCSTSLNGDLVYSEDAAMYGASFAAVKGNKGDSVQYVNENGTVKSIAGATDCSLNSGIALDASDSVPFASVCADNKGSLYLNNGAGKNSSRVKIGTEETQNVAANSTLGGGSETYSHLARFFDTDSYIFTWVSGGAKESTANRNVAVAISSEKADNVQVIEMTSGKTDCQNARVTTFDSSNAIVSWEETAERKYAGTFFQQVRDGKKLGEPIKPAGVHVAGNMVNMGDGRVCWPYVDMAGSLDGSSEKCPLTKAISFACMTLDDKSAGTPSAKPSPSVPPKATFSTFFPVETPALLPSGPLAPPASISSKFPVGAPPAQTPAGGYGAGYPAETPSAPAPTPTLIPDDDLPRPYESVYVPASLSFNPSLAPAFTNIFPGLPGEFTTPPTYPTTPVITVYPPGKTPVPSTLLTRTKPDCSSAAPTPTMGSYY